MNGDGSNDIVGFGQAGVWASFGSASGSFTAAVLVGSTFGQTTGWASDNQFHRELADVNGDGRSDIVGFGLAGTYVSLAKADGSFANPMLGLTDFGTTQGWATQEGFARMVGDVNGDGKADVIGFGRAGTLVSIGNGDGTFQNPTLALANFGVEQGWTSNNALHRTVADVNGDGADDIIGFGYAGTFVALSNGNGTFLPPQLAVNNFGRDQGWASQNGFARDVADVNRDGHADIVGFGVAGTYVAYGQGNASFSAPTFDVEGFVASQGWTSDATYHREVADINNDGMNDIVGFGFAGVYVGYSQGAWLV
ncbi:VCBS repeat-containing protein [Sphingomonas sp. BN140010]|uniref:VCBS repeat-containing protein n=1 Tax=Sphingomonas arvum TaxID=2992113 RepID=A0ABT3JC90_9SPHN|nr:VCBS repeat-containing protein [Sphingomonas sp. BN140010]